MNEKLYEFPNRKFYENKMITKRKILPDENIMNNLPFLKKISLLSLFMLPEKKNRK